MYILKCGKVNIMLEVLQILSWEYNNIKQEKVLILLKQIYQLN